MHPPVHPHPAVLSSPTAHRAASHRLPSVDLFRGRQEVVIEHDGQTYRLRITRQNKLILTK